MDFLILISLLVLPAPMNVAVALILFGIWLFA